MGRQQTLAKFFTMPPSSKPTPPQQASLTELWKKSKSATKVEDSIETESIVEGSSKRREKPLSTDKFPKSKRRRVLDSDDEQAPNASSSSTLPATFKSTSPATDIPVSKSKGNMKAEESAVDEEVSSTSDVENEGAVEVEAMEELVTSTASKNAEAAISRIQDVDIPGGWKPGEPVPYAALAHAFSLIEATTKRLEKTALLTSFLLLVIQRSAEGDHKSLTQAVYLCINRLCPDYMGIELGIGESLLIKAIAESTGRSLSIIKADLKREGDLGLVAMSSKANQKTLFKPKPLTLSYVFTNLKEIAMTSGHSSQAKKVAIITKLLAACQHHEAKYIIRSLEGKLRIGNAEQTVLVALAYAAVLAEFQKAGKKWNQDKIAPKLEQASSTIKAVYSELPSYDEVIPALLEAGVEKLREKCKLRPGIPLKPMLAKPTKAIGEVLDRFEGKRFTCEYKYDGERAQVHKMEDGKIAVFSRNSEDMSVKYPDLMEQLPSAVKEMTKTFVLDAEAVAIDRTTAKLMPFQELSKRKRKDVRVEDIQVRVCLFAFDLLYLNGEPLLHKTLQERRQLLREYFNTVPFEFQFAKASDGDTVEEIQSFLEESVKDGCEGLMVKMLDSDASYYEPSRRSVNWLKLKKDYLAGVGDSLDLVVVGGYYGKGKRTNVYGAFLLACYDSDSEAYQTICKIGTGFSEEALQSHYETLKPLELTKVRSDIMIGGAKPDVWFEPKVVWEVLTADLSLSPIYTAAHGIVDERGISLRFPRFIRLRDDKSVEDATGAEQVAEMYERQVLAQGNGKKNGNRDADDGFW
ncbi:hypothetical protein APHAL10511_006391 [Amanita phalloides]|nr:hypothetical protein APHAL10511_006391 [Amanita phalloides]